MKEDFFVKLSKAIPQLKLRLPKTKNTVIGQEAELEFKGRTIVFRVEEDVNEAKVWNFKWRKREQNK